VAQPFKVAAAGRIEITGNHNDVTRQLVGKGPMPDLVDGGRRNNFDHR
jgi:hypothetical protein